MAAEDADRGATARHLIRCRDHAALATSLAGRPYVSLVATACENDASPLLLLSDLCRGIKEPEREPGRGRPPNALADLAFAACYKVYSGFSGRRFMTGAGTGRSG